MIDLEDFDSEDDEFGQADVDDWDEEDFGLSENDSEEQDCLADDLSQTYGVIDGYHTWEYEPAKPLPTPPPPPPKPLPPPPPPAQAALICLAACWRCSPRRVRTLPTTLNVAGIP